MVWLLWHEEVTREFRLCGREIRLCGREIRLCGREIRLCGREIRLCGSVPRILLLLGFVASLLLLLRMRCG